MPGAAKKDKALQKLGSQGRSAYVIQVQIVLNGETIQRTLPIEGDNIIVRELIQAVVKQLERRDIVAEKCSLAIVQGGSETILSQNENLAVAISRQKYGKQEIPLFLMHQNTSIKEGGLLRVNYTLDKVEMCKSLLIDSNTTAADIIEIALKKFRLEGPRETYYLIAENDNGCRHLFRADELPIKLVKEGGLNVSLVRSKVSRLKVENSEEASLFRSRLSQCLKANPSNGFCIDCGKTNPYFISVNLGVILCAGCATVHAFDLSNQGGGGGGGGIISIIRPLYFNQNVHPGMLTLLEGRGNNNSNKLFKLLPRQLQVKDRVEHILEKYKILHPLKFSSESGFSQKLLLERDFNMLVEEWELGCNVNRLREKDSLPALHFSALAGDAVLVKLLLDMGADSLFCDEEGKTALSYAHKGGNDDVIAMLQHDQTIKSATRQLPKNLIDGSCPLLASSRMLRNYLEHANFTFKQCPVELDDNQFKLLFRDVCKEVERREDSLNVIAVERAESQEKLSRLSNAELSELVSFVFSEQELREMILMEKLIRNYKHPRVKVIPSKDWLQSLLLQQKLEAEGGGVGVGHPSIEPQPYGTISTLIKDAASLMIVSDAGSSSSVTNQKEEEGSLLTQRGSKVTLSTGSLDFLQGELTSCISLVKKFCESLLQGDLSTTVRVALYDATKAFCEAIVKAEGYEPDEECERKLNQLVVATRKIRDMLETTEDIRLETIHALTLLRDVTRRFRVVVMFKEE